MSTLERMLRELGHDEGFEPQYDPAEFLPTHYPAGSREKVEVLRQRVEQGQPLWHERDTGECHLENGKAKCRDDTRGFDGPGIRVCTVRTEKKVAFE